jgi:hypothetical protein
MLARYNKLSSLLGLAALTLLAKSASADTVYGSVTCEPGTGACDACFASPAACNIIGQTTGPRSTCAPGPSATVSPGASYVIANPSVYMLHWGTYWNGAAAEAAGDVNAWSRIGTDWRFWKPLAEYSPGITYTASSAIPFGSSTVPGAVPAMGSATATHSVFISDANDIQAELINEIVANKIPQPDNQRIYVVVLPPYVGTQEYGFSGYHSFVSFSGHYVWYAVIVEQNPPSSFANPQFPTAQWRPRDYLISHELYEATSDPIPGLGWHSQSCGGGSEVADLCEQLFANPIDGYTVATFWSNAANGCVGPAFLDTSIPPTPGIGDGCGYQCNENSDTLQTVCKTVKCPKCTTPAQCCTQAGGYWDGKYCE